MPEVTVTAYTCTRCPACRSPYWDTERRTKTKPAKAKGKRK